MASGLCSRSHNDRSVVILFDIFADKYYFDYYFRNQLMLIILTIYIHEQVPLFIKRLESFLNTLVRSMLKAEQVVFIALQH